MPKNGQLHDVINSALFEPTMNLKWIKKAITDMGGDKCEMKYRLHQMFLDKKTGKQKWELVQGIDEHYL